jgi:CRP-like cAMP-binding protein
LDFFSSLLRHATQALSDPAILFGHFSYFLLIVSMMMRRMMWLRSIAIASGVTKIIYRAHFVIDPVSVFWEAVFVAANAFQLIVLWYFDNHYRFSGEKLHFAERIPTGINRRAVRRVLKLSRIAEYDEGAKLTQEGAPVTDLIYIAEGIVTIERGGQIVAACGPGDHIGELSFLTGNPSTATTIVSKPVRAIVFDQGRLRAAIADDLDARRVVEAVLNHNLAGKLVRSNDTRMTLAEEGA